MSKTDSKHSIQNVARKISSFFSWLFLILAIVFSIFTSVTVFQAKQSGEDAYIFGYRPIFILTGSMEPYIETYGFALSKQITDLDDVQVDDVISFHVTTEAGNVIRVTHRVIRITEDGFVYTKGDNNRVEDGYPLTIENLESKVVMVFNQTAWIADKWNSGLAGKVLLISIVFAVVMIYATVRFWISGRNIEDDETDCDILIASDSESADSKTNS